MSWLRSATPEKLATAAADRAINLNVRPRTHYKHRKYVLSKLISVLSIINRSPLSTSRVVCWSVDIWCPKAADVVDVARVGPLVAELSSGSACETPALAGAGENCSGNPVAIK